MQRDQLRAARCDLAQGYLFDAPLEADAAERLVRHPAGAPLVDVDGWDEATVGPGADTLSA